MWLEFTVSVSDHCQRFGNYLGLAIPTRRMDHLLCPVVSISPRINKADVTAREMLDSAFCQNFVDIVPGI
jgi:hypothetical protein